MENIKDINIEDKYLNIERNEEIREIIERMPTRFALWTTMIVITVFLLLFLFGWLISYPDVISGKITINSAISPVKLVANTSGKIRLLGVSSNTTVKAGTVIAILENAADLSAVSEIKSLLVNYNPLQSDNMEVLSKLPRKAALGELTMKYYTFVRALQDLDHFNRDKLFEKQIDALQKLQSEQALEVQNSNERVVINQRSLEFAYKFYRRDSLLFRDKVAAEAEVDKRQLDYLSSRQGVANALSNQIDSRKQAQQTVSKITETNIQMNEKRKELELTVQAAFNELQDNMLAWEQKYLICAPFDGQVQFLKFWTDNQFVQAGEEVLSVIPAHNQPYGQVILPAYGTGKLKKGQEVIVKLDDYPYMEFGALTGELVSVSLITRTENTEKGELETYLATVRFSGELVTNYGKIIPFRHESKGTAEIITRDRKLIVRFFDNLKYAVNQ